MLNDGYDLVSMGMVVPVVAEEWGVEPSSFSFALSAALIGVLVGSSSAGYLGDRFGRRTTICLMLFVGFVGMASTPLVHTMEQLTVARFVTGIGAGGSIPVTLAYTQEFMPARIRNLLTTFMYTGAGMGSVLAGAFGPAIVGAGGWELVFIIGATVPVFVLIVLIFFLPESIRFLVAQKCDAEKAGLLLERVDRTFKYKEGQTFLIESPKNSRGVIGQLFRGRMLRITLLIWTLFFANQFLLFFSGIWLPTLLVGEGVDFDTALYVSAIFNVGGIIGGIAFGLAGDRVRPTRVLTVTYSLAVVALGIFSLSSSSTMALMIVGMICGATMVGSSFLLGVLTTGIYPVQARATGVGSALAVGRFGAISSPLMGGLLVGMGLGFTPIMLVSTIPAALAAFIALILWRIRADA